MSVQKWIIKNRRNFTIGTRFMGHTIELTAKGYINIEAEESVVRSHFGDTDFEIINRTEFERSRLEQPKEEAPLVKLDTDNEDLNESLKKLQETQKPSLVDFDVDSYDFSIKETFPTRSNGKLIYPDEFKLAVVALGNKYGMTKATAKSGVSAQTYYSFVKSLKGK
jgi:hypothetical protein